MDSVTKFVNPFVPGNKYSKPTGRTATASPHFLRTAHMITPRGPKSTRRNCFICGKSSGSEKNSGTCV